MLRKKQGRCWVSERDGKRVRETATERTRSFAALTCNSYDKRVRETATATERRQQRRWRRRRRVREWEREWERDWDWGESESEKETESEREMITVYVFLNVQGWVTSVLSKPSSLNSVSLPRNRVLWTRFVSIETESNELGFCAYKPSSMNSVYKPRKGVHWTRFLVYVDPHYHLSC